MLEAIFSWNTLRILMWILYVPACLGLIAIVLLQKGKGTGFAGAFGMGAGSEAVFGPRAGRSLPVRLTYAMAAIFVVLAFGLSKIEDKVSRGEAPELIEETEESAELPSAELSERLGEAYNESSAAPAGEVEVESAPAAEAAPSPEAAPGPGAEQTTAPLSSAETAAPEAAAIPKESSGNHATDTGS